MTSTVAGKAYLVTGGASLIGSHIADQLLDQGAAEVRLLDNFALGTPETIAHLVGDPRIRLVRGDILRLNELIDATAGVDGIFALAGFLTLPFSQNPPLGVAVNTTGVVNTLEAARIAGRAMSSSPPRSPPMATPRPRCWTRIAPPPWPASPPPPRSMA